MIHKNVEYYMLCNSCNWQYNDNVVYEKRNKLITSARKAGWKYNKQYNLCLCPNCQSYAGGL